MELRPLGPIRSDLPQSQTHACAGTRTWGEDVGWPKGDRKLQAIADRCKWYIFSALRFSIPAGLLFHFDESIVLETSHSIFIDSVRDSYRDSASSREFGLSQQQIEQPGGGAGSAVSLGSQYVNNSA